MASSFLFSRYWQSTSAWSCTNQRTQRQNKARSLLPWLNARKERTKARKKTVLMGFSILTFGFGSVMEMVSVHCRGSDMGRA
ncbi:hypothetical protein HPP92_002694 [Vanilla planifolia]|uniref:Uncharacterized protein n=1 Tax=Vanilla planifolia TaxID=51239 RepID=A0A835S5Z1_VANPL|nr:hypothetical protein HPP92_002694 [Vanilla planifolia]